MVKVLPITKQKLLFSFITLLLVVSVIYLYLNNLQEKKIVQFSGERCISELTSLKYQLNEVTEYKNRIDKLLTETQHDHAIEKERFKDIIDSCVALKQQSTLCQKHFDDLQSQCKKVRDDYNELKQKFNVM